MTSDAGALLLREIEIKVGAIRRFAACFTDHRNPSRVRHGVYALLKQRVLALACGYEDLNDHAALRSDPLLWLLVGSADPEGAPAASPSTLNRLELSAAQGGASDRYKRLELDEAAAQEVLLELWLAGRGEPAPEEWVVLDLDATDVELHGGQEGRHFHGYYGCYCYLPLYIFEGEHLLWAQLRPSNIDQAAGAKEAVERVVGRLRAKWPGARVLVRGDSGFCREELMAWCESNTVDYVLGLARNARLSARIEAQMAAARAEHERSGEPARCFADFIYTTLKSWSCARRVVAKAEHLSKGPNPRFVVTSLGAADFDARALYEDVYCARGDMENRIKETQLALYADRAGSRAFKTNQLRLWLSALAYVLLSLLRRVGLRGGEWARAQCATIRERLLKIGARIRVSARRVYISMNASYPWKRHFFSVLERLRAHAFG